MNTQLSERETLNSLLQKYKRSTPVDIEGLAQELGLIVNYTFLGQQSGKIKKVDNNFVIEINRLHPYPRQRFTLAHEIGHYLMHKKEIEKKEGLEDDAMLRSGLTNIEEIQANRFASEILMPMEQLNRMIGDNKTSTIQQLADAFRVSQQAIKIRLGIPL